MGHRALIGKTLKNGKVRVYYSHWGALNCYEAGKEKPAVPDEKSPQTWIVKDSEAFGKEVDYLHHEAVWFDDVAYCPIWLYPSKKSDVNKWVTQGFGLLIRTDTGRDFNSHDDFMSAVGMVLGDLTSDFSIEELVVLMINYAVGGTSSGEDEIPKFSPFGYGWKYILPSELIKELRSKKKKNQQIKEELERIRRVLMITKLKGEKSDVGLGTD